ncbi:alternative ribosome-rescue factor A [Pseudoalteromonas phage J2-1_QLiu-2017]|nr:alternative ribosome-rescue factor A [Pseudoalteromonas phage J2-1_QLiu-2017]
MRTANDHDHGRGKTKDNKLKQIVTSDLFRTRVERDKTKYRRKKKHKNREEG